MPHTIGLLPVIFFFGGLSTVCWGFLNRNPILRLAGCALFAAYGLQTLWDNGFSLEDGGTSSLIVFAIALIAVLVQIPAAKRRMES